MLRRPSARLVRFGFIVSPLFALSVVWSAGLHAEQAQQAQQPQAGAASASLPAAKEIIDKYVKATGGSLAFKAMNSMRAKGTFTITGQPMSGALEMMAARPNKLLTRITVTGLGPLEEGFDGKIGWSIDPFNGPALTTGKGLSERADEAWFDGPLHGPEHIKEMSVLAREEFDGRQVYRMKVVSVRGTEQIEFFEVESGLQAGIEATRDTPFGNVPTVTMFRDFQQFGKLKFPSTVVQRLLGQEQTVVFSAYEFDNVPATTFDLPAVIKALIK